MRSIIKLINVILLLDKTMKDSAPNLRQVFTTADGEVLTPDEFRYACEDNGTAVKVATGELVFGTLDAE